MIGQVRLARHAPKTITIHAPKTITIYAARSHTLNTTHKASTYHPIASYILISKTQCNLI